MSKARGRWNDNPKLIEDPNSGPGQIDLGACCNADGSLTGEVFVSLYSHVTHTRATITVSQPEAIAFAEALAQIVAILSCDTEPS